MLKSMKLGTRIAFGFGMVLTMLTVTGTMMALSLRHTVHSYQKVTSQEYRLATQAEHAAVAMLECRRAEKDFFLRSDAAYLAAFDSKLGELKTAATEMATLASVSGNPGIGQSATAINAAAETYGQAFHAVANEYARRGLTPEDGLQGEVRGIAHSIETQITELNLGSMETALLRLRRDEKDYLARHDVVDAQGAYVYRDKYVNKTHASIAGLQEMLSGGRNSRVNAAAVAALTPLIAEYQAKFDALVAANDAIDVAQEHMRAAAHAIEPLVETAASEAISLAEAENAATSTAADRAIWFGMVTVLVSLVAGVFAALLVTRSAVRPLRRIIDGLTAGSQQTASAACQVSSASVSLAEGASRQAATIEETSSSMEEMAAMTRQNAANAVRATSLAAQAKMIADRGVQAMQRMISAIDDIKKSSDSTARIIKTIDEIAFQTNLLALNAAVEAARAGEAGKGFAVVAEEVRNLAQRSADAAKNTAQMIEESVHNADNGVAITRDVGVALSEISAAASEVNELVACIAKASNEQAEGNAQINTSVGQMDHITQANAASAEETASASEELSGQAEEMSSMVRELESMVGGGASGSRTRVIARKLPTLNGAAMPQPAAPKPAAKARNAARARTGKVDHVIAFDEDDLDLVGSGHEMIDI